MFEHLSPIGRQVIIDTSSTDTSNIALTRYCITSHVKGAITLPLSSDPSIKAWLLNKSESIVSEILSAVDQFAVDQFAAWLEQTEGDQLSTARICYSVFVSTNETARKKPYVQKALKALANIPSGTQAGALDLEVKIRSRAAMLSGDSAATESVNWSVFFGIILPTGLHTHVHCTGCLL